MSHCIEDKSHHGAADKAPKNFVLQEMRLQDEEDSEPILILIEDEPLEISTTGNSEDETQEFESGLSENTHEVESKRRKVSEKDRHIECLSKLVSHLKVLNMLSEEDATILLEIFGNDRFMFQRIFSKSLLKSSKEIEISHKYFATTFQFLSPEAYQYVRKNYQCHLLNVPNLSRWYCNSEGRPGFSSEAFEFLKKAQKKIVCSLLYDEMPVRQYEEIYQGQYYGNVDFGCPILGDCMPTAKKVLVFLLVCLNETWKLPLGYFFIADITSEQKKSLVTMCLALLERAKVRVTNITFDESSLKCFKSSRIGEYFLTPDPASMITLIKNHVRDKGPMISSRGTIHSKYLKQPYNHQEDQDKTGNISTTEEANYESLGDSITDALLVFNNVDYAKEFKTADATLDFILLLNEVLAIFSSREIGDSSELEWNIKKVLDFYHYFKSYLNELKYPDGTQVIQTNKVVGLTGLLEGLYAILRIHRIYVKELKLLPSIPVYKWSLDHVNQFFSLFKLPDLDEYPTCRQFSTMYKHIVLNDEMDDTVTVNCIPIESVGIVDLSIDKENSVFEIVNEHDYLDLT